MFGIEAITRGRVALAMGGVALGATAYALTGSRRGKVDRAWHARAELWFAITHPRSVRTTLGAAHDARQGEYELFHAWNNSNGIGDAFRHTYGQALLVLRLMRDEHLATGEAVEVATAAGDAHEAASTDTSPLPTRMDQHNNGVGRAVGVAARRGDGTFASEAQLRGLVLAALASGRAELVDPGTGRLRATRGADLPAQ